MFFYAMTACIYAPRYLARDMVGRRGPLAVTLGGRRFVSKGAAKSELRRILSTARIGEPITNEADRETVKGCALISDDAATIAEGWSRGGKIITVRPDQHSGDLNFVFRMKDVWLRLGAMRAINENKPPVEWSTKTHVLFPRSFQLAVQTLLLSRLPLHDDLLFKIISILAAAAATT